MWSSWTGRVEPSLELQRILAIPRRTDPPAGWRDIEHYLRRPGSSAYLRPVQAQALAELHTELGLFAPIRVGGGKTLITYLAPHMVEAKRPVLLVPAKLRDKTRRDFEALAKDWWEPPEIKVISYETLSIEQHARDLEELAPDLLMCDEAHKLKSHKAACSKRVWRYWEAHQDCVFVMLSGTMTKRSLMDFVHLGQWALGDRFPAPFEPFDLDCWCRALDEDRQWKDSRLHPGVLLDAFPVERLAAFGEIRCSESITLLARVGYRERLVQTPGIVATQEGQIDASIVLQEWEGPALSSAQEEALVGLNTKWELPDGTELLDPVEVWRHALEISQGFWYRWRDEPPRAWMEARKRWAAYCRNVLKRSQTYDTEGQLKKARPDIPELLAWEAVEKTYTPVTVPEWITYSVVDEAVEWVREERGLCWVNHRAVGDAMKRRWGVKYFSNQGLDGGLAVEDWKDGCALSIAANCEGRNLQHYNKNLVLSPPTTGDRWEQMLGRTHRDGQQADEVMVEVYLGCQEARKAFGQALSDSKYQESLVGTQKLRIADILIKGVRR